MKGWTTSERIDYSNVSTDAPKPPPEGLYRVRFMEAKPQPTKEGKPMIKLTVELFENEDGEKVKWKVTDNMVLSQAAAFRVKIVSEALDIEPLTETSVEAAEAFCEEIIRAGKDGCFAKIKHESYTRKGGDPDNEADQRTAARVDRYLNETAVAKSKDSSKANGASTTATTQAAAPRRPRALAPAVS